MRSSGSAARSKRRTGDAAADVVAERVLLVPQVDMHVPESGDGVFAGTVDDVGAFRGLCFADGRDPMADNDNGLARFGRTVCGVDYGHVADRERRRVRG